MDSPVAICNSAFDKIGVEPIVSLNEDSKAGRLALRQYDRIRKALIYDHYWNFAIKRQSLALSPDPVIGGGSRFLLPSDCLRPIVLISQKPYKLEGRTIIVESSEANLKYVYNNTDESSYTPKFAEALAWKLAAAFAYPMVQSTTLMQEMKAEAKEYMLDAASTDAQEDYLDTIHSDQFINSHFAEVDYPSNFDNLRGY